MHICEFPMIHENRWTMLGLVNQYVAAVLHPLRMMNEVDIEYVKAHIEDRHRKAK